MAGWQRQQKRLAARPRLAEPWGGPQVRPCAWENGRPYCLPFPLSSSACPLDSAQTLAPPNPRSSPLFLCVVSSHSRRLNRHPTGRRGVSKEGEGSVRGRPMICARRWPWPGFERMNTRPEHHIVGVSPATRCEALLRCAHTQLATTRRSSGSSSSSRSSRLCWSVSAAVGAAWARRGY